MKSNCTLLFIFLFFINLTDTYSQVDSLFLKQKNGKYGYVNKKGKTVIKFQFDYAKPFTEGFAPVLNISLFHFIDTTGKVAFEGNFFDAGNFSEGLAYVSNIKNGNVFGGPREYGFINNKGELVIDYKYLFADDFKNGFAIVLMENENINKYGEGEYISGVIDKNDKLLADKWFSSISRYSNDTFFVHIKDKVYKLISNGELIEIIIKIDTTLSIDTAVSYYEVEIRPEFPGGAIALNKFICENVKYPYSAKEAGIQGKVFVSFIVTETGSVQDIKIIKGVHPLLDNEAVRVIKEFPDFSPGILNGKYVKVKFTVPVNFKLF